MHYTPALKRVIQATLPVYIKLYGVNVNIYAPTNNFDSAAQNFGNLDFTESAIFSGKVLIPSLLVKRSPNVSTMFDFNEGEHVLYATTKIPMYSKVVLTESHELSQYIIKEPQETEDVADGSIYFKYVLIPSAELLDRPEINSVADQVLVDEDLQSQNPVFTESIEGNEIPKPTVTPSTVLKYKRL